MTIAATHELKTLKTRLAKAELERQSAAEEARAAQKRESETVKRCESLKQQIAALERKGPIISEHALLRYIERVMGLDLDAVRAEMLPDSTKSMIQTMGDGRYPSVNCRLVVKDRTVVTVEN